MRDKNGCILSQRKDFENQTGNSNFRSKTPHPNFPDSTVKKIIIQKMRARIEPGHVASVMYAEENIVETLQRIRG